MTVYEPEPEPEPPVSRSRRSRRRHLREKLKRALLLQLKRALSLLGLSLGLYFPAASKFQKQLADYWDPVYQPYLEYLKDTFRGDISPDLTRYTEAYISNSYRFTKNMMRSRLAVMILALLSFIVATAAIAVCAFPLNSSGQVHASRDGALGFSVVVPWSFAALFSLAVLTAIALCFKQLLGSPSRLFLLLFPRLRPTTPLEAIIPPSRWASRVLPLVLTASALAAAVAAKLVSKDQRDFELSVFLGLYMLYAVIALSVIILTRYAVVWVAQVTRALPPADVAAFGQVLSMLQLAPEIARNIYGRRLLITGIGALARSFEVAIPELLGVPNDISDPSKIGFLRIARDIRGLRTWAAFPQADTTDALCKRLATIEAAIASNEYHYIYPQELDFDYTAKKTLRARILSFLRNVAIGLVPAVALIVVEALNVPLSTGEYTTWTIAAVLWFTVSILATQPDFRDRIAATKDVVNLMTGGK